ncbi:hypothetical protein BT96DRAFT_974393 [Gymnopus androsaceus JB14]|uniref:C2H2-type domain-containing protein n=1 Tax=Gymnopus androsaceus JB14 TaxID=1447944 RepID=A0A6A4HVW6_9AGAR|nr:hypothetical protein BT96DRAFT_974393 [Gymnopus androsaceus JB14]
MVSSTHCPYCPEWFDYYEGLYQHAILHIKSDKSIVRVNLKVRATQSGAAEVLDGNSPERVRAGPREIWDSVKLLATPLTRRKVSREENNRVRPKLSQGGGTKAEPRFCRDHVAVSA